MDEDIKLITAVSLIFLGILSATAYGCYRWGKWQERKDYTIAFIHATEETYNEAYADGEKLGRSEGDRMGYQRGMKDGYKKCLNEDYIMKDNY